MKKWLSSCGCGSCSGCALLLFILVVVVIAVVIITAQIYVAAIYTWFFSDDVDVPLSIHGLPTTGVITAIFHDPWYLENFGVEHQGIDIANGRGTPIYCTSDEARIVGGGFDAGGYGLYVKLEDIESGYFIIYAHLDSVSSAIMGAYATGTIDLLRLEHGDLVGAMDSTGNSTGDHLHYEIRGPDNIPVNPEGSEGCCVEP